jgi:cell division protein FtsW
MRFEQGFGLRFDRGILLVLFTLFGVGLVQVYSSSFIFATEAHGDGLFFVKRQFIFTLASVGALFVFAHLDMRAIMKFSLMFWLMAAILVAATYIPGVGTTRGGATRWFALPFGFVFEPSELLKLSLSLVMASFFAFSKNDFIARHFGDWSKPVRLLIVLVPLIFLLKQPDFGGFSICMLVIICLLFAFGLQLRWLVFAGAAAIPGFYFLVLRVPYRLARVQAFMDPWSDPGQKGFQLIQSMLSFQGGGLTGVGLGQGQGKLFFLPEAHTDFTLAVLGEEMGFLGVAVVILLFSFLILRGIQIAYKSDSIFCKAASLGLTLNFAFSAFINCCVVLGLLPTKGLTLPFLSYGGSSLVMQGILFGILLNIEKYERESIGKYRKPSRLAGV